MFQKYIFWILLSCVNIAYCANDYPIIGIFTQPSTSNEGNCGGNCLYLASSYVKFIESAGGRVVPINYYANSTTLDYFLGKLNGILFPGGGSQFPNSAQYVYDKVIEINKNGQYFPLLGICMGFQWLLISQTSNQNILDPKSGQFDSYNYSIPLDFIISNPTNSTKLFKYAGQYIIDILSNENVTMNNHHYGIFTEHFNSESKLNNFFKLISTNLDRKSNNFVSTIESFDYPIYGLQWHPEKNIFEFGNDNGYPNEAIVHTSNSIKISQYIANYFVNQTKINSNSFGNDQNNKPNESKYLIENWFDYKTTGSFMQTYFFSKDF
jgi:gamma-glutamyl hydrolase